MRVSGIEQLVLIFTLVNEDATMTNIGMVLIDLAGQLQRFSAIDPFIPSPAFMEDPVGMI